MGDGTMHDHIVGGLARERHADYLREVKRVELAAQLHRDDAASGDERSSRPALSLRGWRGTLAGLLPNRPAVHGQRP
jgi:hypothetical protein